ncbi:c-type cytochrome biogenesis protein CcmI [Atopomonas sediminilitoris]|uniref:c-type cytochrome biogenesis protein CcmI n=1 Tax=Atopomonas sediminilitoris TaxID=2919919 RepID=UPI001F4E8BA5|nr:c-type cytochrome biogenesis protein CcmI [Atopomonas sediminilitoris]MCJ8167910.1 c-type cytochrome biogenesis protein CcmI [Atopomonas sediminilitoris]
MTDFWLAAGLLLLLAASFVLLPALRGVGVRREHDRTAMNVALYEERIAALQEQQQAGILTDEQFAQGEAEAARELLADAEQEQSASASSGRWWLIGSAFAMPALALLLYWQWGAYDALSLARENRQAPPHSIEEVTARLERSVQAQPESAENWYFLGRSYMALERPADAAKAFNEAMRIAGRETELMAQLAQAQYFAGGKVFSPEVRSLTDEVLQNDPQEVTTLGLLGIAAFEEGRFADAVSFWERLVNALPPQDPTAAAIQGGIARAKERLAEASVEQGVQQADQPVAQATEPATAQADAPLSVTVQVSLDQALAAKVAADDSVFIFAKANNGMPMPLAVKRLTVADLPATVSLSDADAMMPQLKLSGFAEIIVQARISRSGKATEGQWQGAVAPFAPQTDAAVAVTIDQAM